MARYSRADIEALSKRLEIRASVMMPDAGRDLMAAALLLRLMLALAEIDIVETTIGATWLNDGQWPS